ncbi:hypothetical protein Tco_0578314 [Tanacetum coccineum]
MKTLPLDQTEGRKRGRLARMQNQQKEPEFEVADSDMPQDQEENLEPTNPDWNIDKTPQQGQNQSWLMTLASSAEKPSKTFDELMSTPIDFSAFIMNGLKINNLLKKHLTQVGVNEETWNWLTNLSGDDVSNFAIALRMFTRSLVIQNRVKDLQLGVKSYQNKINVTKPKTTKSEIRKMDLYTPYQDPQGFIYVDNNRKNRLMRSDELYKFNDRTLTRL